MIFNFPVDTISPLNHDYHPAGNMSHENVLLRQPTGVVELEWSGSRSGDVVFHWWYQDRKSRS